MTTGAALVVDALVAAGVRHLFSLSGNQILPVYDATIGRWTSQDPLGFDAGDANLYRYVGNAPTGYLDAFGLEPLDPAVDGPRAAEQRRGHGLPGVAGGEEQEDMGAESDLRIGVLTIEVEQLAALVSDQDQVEIHGRRFRVRSGLSSIQLYRPGPLSLLRGSI